MAIDTYMSLVVEKINTENMNLLANRFTHTVRQIDLHTLSR